MKYEVTVEGETFLIEIEDEGEVFVNGQAHTVDMQSIDDLSLYSLLVNNNSYEAFIEENEGQFQVLLHTGEMYSVQVKGGRPRPTLVKRPLEVPGGEVTIKAPMPGLVVAVPVVEGQQIMAGGDQVVAVCDVDAKHREAARAKINTLSKSRGCAAYGDFREVVARDDIDAVVVATPDHWHVPIAIAAVKAGKAVYVEKPLSLTIREGRELAEVVSSPSVQSRGHCIIAEMDGTPAGCALLRLREGDAAQGTDSNFYVTGIVHPDWRRRGVGSRIMEELLAKGKSVRMVNRSGQATLPEPVELVSGDATDAEFARQASQGASVVFQCLNPPYSQWPEIFPALQAGVLEGAIAAGAKMVSMENVYMYGSPGGKPMTEDMPYAAA